MTNTQLLSWNNSFLKAEKKLAERKQFPFFDNNFSVLNWKPNCSFDKHPMQFLSLLLVFNLRVNLLGYWKEWGWKLPHIKLNVFINNSEHQNDVSLFDISLFNTCSPKKKILEIGLPYSFKFVTSEPFWDFEPFLTLNTEYTDESCC